MAIYGVKVQTLSDRNQFYMKHLLEEKAPTSSYLVGVELAERLNSETMGVCDMQTMLGVVLFVTKLGMASLLPHRSLDFDPGIGRTVYRSKSIL